MYARVRAAAAPGFEQNGLAARWALALLKVIAAMLMLCGGSSVASGEIPLAAETSDSPWRQATEETGVDSLVLYAIALQESRRTFTDGQVRPWPWTLHTPEEGAMYFHSYAAALEKLNALLSEGQSNIDIGAMQINWRCNGHRLRDPALLLLPRNNIAVAAQILREHLAQNGGNWERAVARYHSPRPELGEPYAASVLTMVARLRMIGGLQQALGAKPASGSGG